MAATLATAAPETGSSLSEAESEEELDEELEDDEELSESDEWMVTVAAAEESGAVLAPFLAFLLGCKRVSKSSAKEGWGRRND